MEHIIQFEHLKKFILGGKAEIVVRNTNSGNHIGYKITKSKSNSNTFFVKHLKVFIGAMYSNVDLFTPTPNMINRETIQFKVFFKLHDFIFNKNKLPNDVQVLYTGKCSKCGRKLKDPEYIKIGIGKYCLENN